MADFVRDFETGGGVNQERVWRIMVDAFVAYYNHRRYHESIDNLCHEEMRLSEEGKMTERR
jgi:hypothetical protein